MTGRSRNTALRRNALEVIRSSPHLISRMTPTNHWLRSVFKWNPKVVKFATCAPCVAVVWRPSVVKGPDMLGITESILEAPQKANSPLIGFVWFWFGQSLLHFDFRFNKLNFCIRIYPLIMQLTLLTMSLFWSHSPIVFTKCRIELVYFIIRWVLNLNLDC